MPTCKDYVIATRPWSFSMSAISVTLGTLIAWQRGAIHWGWYAAVVLGVVLCHAAGNVLNDFFDARNRVDHADSATARYRPHPILGGLMAPRTALLQALVLFASAAAVGLAAVLLRSPHVLWIAGAGFLLTFFYSGGPLTLKYRALGEVAVFLIWGPLMFQGAYAVQRQALSWPALVASVPFGTLVALVLFANNIRDADQDREIGIRTLGTALGRSRGLVAFSVFIICAYIYTLLAIVGGLLSPWVLL
ncbi:MAG: prenyltransferase, partial [Acidobacteria bacterium]|nr:prenyltransferase [Acidobacteriota bacterium]